MFSSVNCPSLILKAVDKERRRRQKMNRIENAKKRNQPQPVPGKTSAAAPREVWLPWVYVMPQERKEIGD
jgi:hypothetical protein